MTTYPHGLACGLLMLCTAAAGQASAQNASQNDVTVFAGGKLDVADSAYAGAAIGLPGSNQGRGLALRGAVFTGSYEYDAAGTPIDADFTGAQIELAWRYSSADTWGSVGVGYRYTDTDLSPPDPGNRRDGGQGEAIVSVDGGHVSGPWRVDWYGSYGFRLDDYDAQASVTHSIGTLKLLRVGVEVGADGDSNYSAYRVGPMLGLRLDDRSEIQLSAGYSDGDQRDSQGYVRIGFYRSF